MFNLKNSILNLIISLFTVITYANSTSPPLSSSDIFFLSGTFQEHGVTINYSAILNISLAESKTKLALQLTSFLIEDATYNNTTYRDNDIFGISFPIDTEVEITSNIQLLNDSNLIDKIVVLHPHKKTYLKIKKNTVNLSDLKVKISKTIIIKDLVKHEIFVEDIKKAIKNNETIKNTEELAKEQTRLIILGNEYLNQNNYSQATLTYLKAKEYGDKTNDIAARIRIVAKYAAENKPLVKKEKRTTPSENGKKHSDVANNTSLKTTNDSLFLKEENKHLISKKITSTTPESNSEIKIYKSDNDEYFEVIKTKKGYIKYKKDEQAVVDSKGNILIPYGKYEIIRFKAGFARVKIKDYITIKNIVCTNKSDQYTWSARIYENPWQESVINEYGDFVENKIKKVEIYIVDNVTHRPNKELSTKLLKRYEDPNPFKGSQQISAFNLWNRDHANDPEVLIKRKEIKQLKSTARKEAYAGAKKCRNTVSAKFEEVYNYYLSMGYEVTLKN